MLKVNYRNTGTRCEIGSKLTIKIPDIALLLISELIANLFSIDYVNIYLFSLCFPIDFARW